MDRVGKGFSIGRFWVALFHFEDFFGIWFSFGTDNEYPNSLILQIQIAWLQLCIGYDFKNDIHIS
jgi:hypothetical protein